MTGCLPQLCCHPVGAPYVAPGGGPGGGGGTKVGAWADGCRGGGGGRFMCAWEGGGGPGTYCCRPSIVTVDAPAVHGWKGDYGPFRSRRLQRAFGRFLRCEGAIINASY